MAAAAVNAEPGSDGSGGAGGEGGGNSCPGRWACKRVGEHHRLLSVVRWVDYLISIALVACLSLKLPLRVYARRTSHDHICIVTWLWVSRMPPPDTFLDLC